MGKKSISSLRMRRKHTQLREEGDEDEKEASQQSSFVTKKEEEVDHQSEQAMEGDGNNRKRKRVRKRKSESGASDGIDEERSDNKEDKNESSGDRFSNNRTIYMEGLPFDATEATITSFFSKIGPLVGLRLPRWHDSGRLRGYGHAEFGTADEAQRALDKLNGAYMGRRYIKLERPMTPRVVQQQQLGAEKTENGKRAKLTRPAGCRTVFVKNLPYDCEEKDVTDSFMICGKISKVRLACWNHTGKLKGFGYVDFKSEESAEIAVNKSVYGGGINVKGRPVICDFETGQAKGSYKPLDQVASKKN